MINKKKVRVLTLSTISICFMVGCSNIENKFHLDKSSLIPTVEVLNNIDIKNSIKYDNTIVDYNLGKVNLGDDKELVNIDLKGTIGVPKKLTNAPIVFIMSGNNNSISKESNTYNDTYKGFEYLVDALSKSGFLTVSINTNIIADESQEEFIVEDKILNLIFEKHYDSLKKAIEGKSGKYPISLYKKGDIKNIGLIGQNNTGRTIYNIANQEILNESSKIKGLLSITPTSGTAISSYPDVPSSILSTEHSVDTHIGFDMYNDIEKINDRESFSQLTYLIGGDSDKFNNLVKEGTLNSVTENLSNTPKLARVSVSVNEDTIKDESTHEEFLSSYAVDFFEYIFGKDIKNSLFDVETPTVQKLYQKDILSKLHVSDSIEIFNSKLDSNIYLNNIKVKNVIESSISSIDTAIDFNEPSTNIELNLLQLDWKNKNSSMEVLVDKSKSNFSNYNSISIEWALNHASELNINDIDKVSLILEDKDNNKSQVLLLDELPLNKIIGNSEVKFIDDKSFSTWSRFTPIAETRIPLNLLTGIDLNNIEKIEINFGNNQSGSVYIKNISLKK